MKLKSIVFIISIMSAHCHAMYQAQEKIEHLQPTLEILKRYVKDNSIDNEVGFFNTCFVLGLTKDKIQQFKEALSHIRTSDQFNKFLISIAEQIYQTT